MIAAHCRKSLAFGIPGLALQIVFYVSLPSLAWNTAGISSNTIGWLAIAAECGLVAGTVLFFVGMCYYAKAKGYSAALGLLGLLSCGGLIVLALLPDKTKT
jgi:hypothetical protein